MSAEEPSRPPVAPALIVGGVKGFLAGALVAAVPGVLMFLPRAPLELARTVLAGALAGACLCGFDATSARLAKTWQQRLSRFASGLLLPACFAAPWLGIVEVQRAGGVGPLTVGDLALALALGASLGAGAVAVGQPGTEAHEAQGCYRLLRVAALATSIVFVVAGPGALGILIVAAALWVAEVVVAPFLRPLAHWLEPGLDLDAALKRRVREALEKEVLSIRRVVAQANEPWNDQRALLAWARQSLSAPLLDASPPTIQRLRAEILLGLGALDDAEKLLPLGDEEPLLRAELARRRGDPARAADIALEWLRTACDVSERARFVRGNAGALLALARADEGRHAEALETAQRVLYVNHQAAFDFLAPHRVRAYVEASKARVRLT